MSTSAEAKVSYVGSVRSASRHGTARVSMTSYERHRRLKPTMFSVVMAGLLVTLASVANSDSSRARQVLSAIRSSSRSVSSLGPTQLRLSLVEEHFPLVSETDIRRIVDEERERIRSQFGNDPTFEERRSAVEHNVRSKLGNHVVQSSTLVVTADGARWRLEQTIRQREELVQPSAELRGNPFIRAFKPEVNRLRIYAWDGEDHRVLFLTDDRLTRNGQIHTGDRNRGLMEQALRLGRVPPSLEELMLDPDLRIEVVSEGTDAVELRMWKDEADWRASIVAAPQYGYALMGMDLEAPDGLTLIAEYGGYRQVDGVWVPSRTVEQWSRGLGAERRLVRRREWLLEAASFRAVIEDAKATFSPPMPDEASVIDYRFSPPLRYRTDQEMHVADDVLAALVASVPGDLSMDTDTSVPGPANTAGASTGLTSQPVGVGRSASSTVTLAGPWQFAVLLVALAGLLLAAAIGLIARMRRHRHAHVADDP